MKTISFLVCGAALVLGAAGPARAQGSVDMSKVTCEKLLSGGGDAIDTAVWLSGYYNGLHKNTKLDLSNFKNNAQMVVAECKDHPKSTVMSTIGKMLSGKK